jgi:hypothetical protein
MHTSLKWLVTASLVNLAGNSLGAVISLGQNLAADWGGTLNGQDVLRDFLGFKGTALSAPLSFMLIQLVIILLALRPGRVGKVGVGGLTFIGLFYTLAQVGEPIVLRQFHPGGFDLLQFLVLMLNIISAIAMLVMGIRAWRTMRVS